MLSLAEIPWHNFCLSVCVCVTSVATSWKFGNTFNTSGLQMGKLEGTFKFRISQENQKTPTKVSIGGCSVDQRETFWLCFDNFGALISLTNQTYIIHSMYTILFFSILVTMWPKVWQVSPVCSSTSWQHPRAGSPRACTLWSSPSLISKMIIGNSDLILIYCRGRLC